MNEINSFYGSYRFLSNFYESPIPFDGIIAPTVEHAYQASKTTDPAERQKVLAAETPGRAKSLGRRVPLRPDWEECKLSIMYSLLQLKFAKGTELCDKLLATGDAQLVEGNKHGDTYWGVCYGRGENNLGKLLMRVRAEARSP